MSSIVISNIFFCQIPLDLSGIPPITVDDDTLVLIIEQLLMLILIIGRWMLPKVIFYMEKYLVVLAPIYGAFMFLFYCKCPMAIQSVEGGND